LFTVTKTFNTSYLIIYLLLAFDVTPAYTICQHHKLRHADQQQLQTNQPLLPVRIKLRFLCTRVFLMEDLRLAPNEDKCKHESLFGAKMLS